MPVCLALQQRGTTAIRVVARGAAAKGALRACSNKIKRTNSCQCMGHQTEWPLQSQRFVLHLLQGVPAGRQKFYFTTEIFVILNMISYSFYIVYIVFTVKFLIQ